MGRHRNSTPHQPAPAVVAVEPRFEVLSLVSATRRGGQGRAERSFLDFVIGRRRLSSLIRNFDNVGVLGSLGRTRERHHARQLLLREPSELASGRVPLYVCAECADLGCAGVTARVTRLGDRVIWSDFRCEGHYDDAPLDTYWPLPDLSFEWEAYRLLLTPFA